METARSKLLFRWAVFALTVFFSALAIVEIEPAKIGWHFRFLTYWALTLSMISAWFMIRRSRGLTAKRHEVLASATVVLNIMVVVLYWKIYLNDPTAFYVDGIRTSPLWKEYYLHALGPILQWIDAFFILGVFRPIRKIIALVATISIGYSIWLEALVRPLNSEPIGNVTQGLPYRFLNNLEFSDRLGFYGQNILSSVVLVGICWLIAKLIAKTVRPALYARTSETGR